MESVYKLKFLLGRALRSRRSGGAGERSLLLDRSCSLERSWALLSFLPLLSSSCESSRLFSFSTCFLAVQHYQRTIKQDYPLSPNNNVVVELVIMLIFSALKNTCNSLLLLLVEFLFYEIFGYFLTLALSFKHHFAKLKYGRKHAFDIVHTN